MNKLKLSGGVGAIAAIIIAAVLNVEGGYVNDPQDPGGETNHGVTIAVARDHGYTGSMKDLPKEFAEEIYYQDYILKPKFNLMVEVNPAVAHKLIDIGVNTGTTRPSRWFQETMNALSNNGKSYPQINVDGKVGPQTISSYRALENQRGKVKACELTLKMLDGYQSTFYVSLDNPKFTVGWIDHRIGNVPIERCKDYATSVQ